MTTSYYDFKTLRAAYKEVKAFLESEMGTDVPSVDARIEQDLGCAGDDSYELVAKFIDRYQLDATGYDAEKHFLSEGEQFNAGVALLQLLSLPFIVLFKAVTLLSGGMIGLNDRSFFPDANRATLDMSFGDLLAWYLSGRYTLRQEVLIRVKEK